MLDTPPPARGGGEQGVRLVLRKALAETVIQTDLAGVTYRNVWRTGGVGDAGRRGGGKAGSVADNLF